MNFKYSENEKQKYLKSMDRLTGNIADKYNTFNSKDDDISKQFRERFKDSLAIKPGLKFDKIVMGTSVWGFVAKKNFRHKGIDVKVGDVMKAATFRQAARHPRGSIFDKNTDWFSWSGPEYMFTKKARLESK